MTFLAGKKTTCPKCGAVYDDPVVFCGACGTRIVQKAPTAGVPAPPPAPLSVSTPKSASSLTSRQGVTQREIPVLKPYQPTPKLPEIHPLPPELPPPPVAPVPEAPVSTPRKSKPPDSKGPRKRKSTRPAAPTLAEWDTGPEPDQKLLDEVDAGFYSIVQPRKEHPSDDGWPTVEVSERTPDPVDVAAVVELFEQLAPIYAGPLRDFMIELAWGDASKNWLAVCAPAARSLRTASDKMDMSELRVALDDFLAAVQLAEAAEGSTIGSDAKEILNGSYEKLVQIMPHVFALEQERGRREPLIVHSLLQQVRGVGKVTVDKIYAAGLTTLGMLYAAHPEELAVTAGISLDLSRAICDRFQSYRTEVQQVRPDAGRQADRKKLETLVRELRVLNDAYKGASTGWSAQASKDKRWLRSERERTFLEIAVVLARTGEVELLKQLERLPFERRAAQLDTFLRDTRTKGQSSS